MTYTTSPNDCFSTNMCYNNGAFCSCVNLMNADDLAGLCTGKSVSGVCRGTSTVSGICRVLSTVSGICSIVYCIRYM